MTDELEIDLDGIRDVIDRMKIQETTIYNESQIQDELVGLWRKMLIEWMYYVIDHCHLHRQSVAAAAFFFDAAVRKRLVQTPEEHQLAAATALQLALKTHDSSVIRLERLVQLGRGLFKESDVVEMEQKLLLSLQWHVNPPTTYCFLKQYERVLPITISETTKSMIKKVTSLACEVTLVDCSYLYFSPSELAYACMLMALEMIPCEDLPIVQRQVFVLRMASVAKMDSKSPKVLEAFENLQQSMNTCPKLKDLVYSLEKHHKKQARESRIMRSQSKALPPNTHSPRHVMIRLMSG